MRSATEREEFSRRLRQLLGQNRLPAESPARVAREFNDRFPQSAVTAQAVRKWLIGEAIPDQSKVKALASWLNCPTEWLRYGEPDLASSQANQPAAPLYRVEMTDQEVIRRFRRLGQRQQSAIAELLIALSSKSK